MGVRGRAGSGVPARTGDVELSVVLLHGVGVAPTLFDGLIAELAAAGVTAIAPLRAGYRGDGTPHDVADAVRDVVALTRSTGRVVLVGVDGGATLALVAALTGDRSIAAAVVHEPIVGPFSPSLHRIVLDQVGVLGRSSSPAATAEVMAALVGQEAWTSLPPDAIAFVADHDSALRSDLARLATFELATASMRTMRTPITVTTGQHSGASRHAAAAAIAGVAPVRLEVVPGCGHLAWWEHPVEYARIVLRSVAAATTRDR